MRERPHDGPLPAAHPMPGGRPPQPDGDRVPCPARLARAPVSRRQYAYGATIAVVVLVLLVLGVLG
ncbi:hypothetical protein [Micromonospora carbonacea]|uniref:Uncharacterized protein n=1 Tax=Micromonospora carbonacea TaxID=47853 RepID=A0A1C4ZEY3_9ACTN|nr:hypothetical protein [Micromonospora carbonacea]SCF31560.1 hypothetical protein GA0070563_108109 [Micromonospora carbonacea]